MKNKKLYLTATYYRVPAAGVNSSQKDFGKNDNNWTFNEQVEIVRTLKRRDQTMANIILNISDKKVEKCNMRENVGYAELYRYFKTNYPQYFSHIDMLEPTITTIDVTPEQVNADSSPESEQMNQTV